MPSNYKNVREFDSREFVERLKGEYVGGLFAAIADEYEIEKLEPKYVERVLNLAYEKYLSEAHKSYIHPLESTTKSDVKAPALWSIYNETFRNQALFEFVFCASLIAFDKEKLNLVKPGSLPYTFTDEIGTAIGIKKSLEILKAEVDKIDMSKPKMDPTIPRWVQNCARTFGQKKFSEWIASPTRFRILEGVKRLLMNLVSLRSHGFCG